MKWTFQLELTKPLSYSAVFTLKGKQKLYYLFTFNNNNKHNQKKQLTLLQPKKLFNQPTKLLNWVLI